MPMFSIVADGSYQAIEMGLKKFLGIRFDHILYIYAAEGRERLAIFTPVDTGLASESWWYDVKQDGDKWEVIWGNSDIENGFPVAVMRQYGYVNGTGYWVEGIDYITPALDPTIDKIINAVWQEVMQA